MTARRETLPFQAEAQEVLGLMIHSLYKHRDIFLRELVSNASDALDKLRFEALTHPELSALAQQPQIRIEVDREQRTLAVIDNGIGMTRDELQSNLGTIARSGTRQYLASARGGKSENVPELIGQFGVGFYSSFIVADEVTVETRRAGAGEAWTWSSRGEGGFTLEPSERAEHGTRVTLHLRPPSASATEDAGDETGDDAHDEDFLAEWTIRAIIKRYSDFVGYPIEMEVEHWEPKPGGKPDEGRTTRKLEVLNSMKPLWSRAKDAITREEYDEFYRHITHDSEPPLEVIHFRAEGTTEYTALLYIPAHRPFDMFEDAHGKSRLALYVKRVLIMPEASELLPNWLRFVRGLVDAPDLPLNVSREVLQHDPIVRQIRKRLVKRVLETLAALLHSDRERYTKFWGDFGTLLKEGIYVGDDEDQRISKLALFETSRRADGEDTGGNVERAGATTLGEYVARMKPGQKAIHYLIGNDLRALASSPHLEPFTKRGYEVLLLADPVDEWLVERLRVFDKHALQAIDRGESELDTESEKQARENLEREHRELLKRLEEVLAGDIKSVRLTNRLVDSPALLVNELGAISPNMERMLRAAHQEVPQHKRVLELNPEHALFKRLSELHAKKPQSTEFSEFGQLLYGQALLAEGSVPANPAEFARLVTRLMVSEPRAG